MGLNEAPDVSGKVTWPVTLFLSRIKAGVGYRQRAGLEQG